MDETQAGAAGLNDRHWADGWALIHQAVASIHDDKDSDKWAALLAYLVGREGQEVVDVTARTGGLLTG